MMEHDHKGTAAATLDVIREGGQQLVLSVLAKCEEVKDAMEQGRFVDALRLCQEVTPMVTALAGAEQHIGYFGDTALIRAREVEEGMLLRQWGRVTSAETIEVDVPGDEPCVHVKIRTEDGEEREVHADQQMAVARQP